MPYTSALSNTKSTFVKRIKEPQPQVGHCHTHLKSPNHRLATVTLIYRTSTTNWPLSYKTPNHRLATVTPIYRTPTMVGHRHTHLQNLKYRLATITLTEPQPRVGHCHTHLQNPNHGLDTVTLIYRTQSTGWLPSDSFTEPKVQVGHCHTH